MAKVADGDVRELIAELRKGEWWRTVIQGPNPTSFSTDMTGVARSVAAALERLTEQSDAIRREKNAERE